MNTANQQRQREVWKKVGRIKRDAVLLRNMCLRHPEATALVSCLQTAANILDSKVRETWRIYREETKSNSNQPTGE